MKVLIAYDGSPAADAAIEDLPRAGLPREGEALIVCVADESWPSTKGAAADMQGFVNSWKAGLHEAERLAKGARDRLQAALPGWKVPSEALWGPTAKSILKTAEWFEPDLLVVGSHGRSAAARLVLGSVSLSLLHHANFPVRIVREKTPAPSGPIRILIATDGSPSALAAVDEVARRAWPAGAQARVVSVFATLVPEPTMIPALEGRTFATEPAFKVILEADEHERRRLGTIVEAAAKILEHAGLAVDAKVLDGDPRTDILREARNWSADTIFIGARGVGTLDRLLLGSVSTAVVTHADCTVEVIRRGKRSKL